jgi:hypothetical protein
MGVSDFPFIIRLKIKAPDHDVASFSMVPQTGEPSQLLWAKTCTTANQTIGCHGLNEI